MKQLLILLLCLPVLQACASRTLPSLPNATSLQVEADQMVVIGKFELVPPINPDYEQRRCGKAPGEVPLLDHLFMATGPQYKPIKISDLNKAEFQSSLQAVWGVPFMVKAPRQRTFFNGGVTYLNIARQERLWFPGGYYFDVPSDAQAVYIGTLRFYRNDFNVITRIEVFDERQDISRLPITTDGLTSRIRTSLLKKHTDRLF